MRILLKIGNVNFGQSTLYSNRIHAVIAALAVALADKDI